MATHNRAEGQTSSASFSIKLVPPKGMLLPLGHNQQVNGSRIKTTVVPKKLESSAAQSTMMRIGLENHPNLPRPTLPSVPASLPASTGYLWAETAATVPVKVQLPAIPAPACDTESHNAKQVDPAKVVTLADPAMPKMLRNGKWSPSEDKQLRDAVDLIGLGDWEALAAMVATRTGSQCKDRWTLFLASDLNNSDLTPEEVALMKKLLPEYVRNRKKPWAKLAQSFSNRSGSILKNAWKRYENSQKPPRSATMKEIKPRVKKNAAATNDAVTMAVDGDVLPTRSASVSAITHAQENPIYNTSAHILITKMPTIMDIQSVQVTQDDDDEEDTIMSTPPLASSNSPTSLPSHTHHQHSYRHNTAHTTTTFPTPKPILPHINATPAVFAPMSPPRAPFAPLAHMNALRSPISNRNGGLATLDSSLMSPPRGAAPQSSGGFFSPGPAQPTDRSFFFEWENRTENPQQYQTHGFGFAYFPTDLHTSVSLPDTNNASTEWNFPEHHPWRV